MSESEGFQADPPPERPPAAPPPRSRPRYDDEDEGRFRRTDDPVSTIIPYTNPKALAAYYCGVFSLIPCVGAVLGPIALILGILGLRYVGQHPTAKGTGHAIAGIVLGGLTLLFNWGAIIFFVIGAVAAGRSK
jgi:hypothetical protein